MLIRKRDSSSEERQSHLTAMIDIVFLLLVFFVMTFRVVVSEGDFYVKAPASQTDAQKVDIEFDVPLQIELRAGPGGQLTGINLDGKTIRDVDSLATAVRNRLPLEEMSRARATAIIRCDQALKYEHTIRVVGIVHGPPEAPLVQSLRLEKTGA